MRADNFMMKFKCAFKQKYVSGLNSATIWFRLKKQLDDLDDTQTLKIEVRTIQKFE